MAITEAQTRADLIDVQLVASGWNVKDPTQAVEEFDILTSLPDGVTEPRTKYKGHQFSDYVLLGNDRKPLAVVEAKKSSRDAAIGGSKPSSIATTFKNNSAASCHSAFTPTGTKPIYGA